MLFLGHGIEAPGSKPACQSLSVLLQLPLCGDLVLPLLIGLLDGACLMPLALLLWICSGGPHCQALQLLGWWS